MLQWCDVTQGQVYRLQVEMLFSEYDARRHQEVQKRRRSSKDLLKLKSDVSDQCVPSNNDPTSSLQTTSVDSDSEYVTMIHDKKTKIKVEVGLKLRLG